MKGTINFGIEELETNLLGIRGLSIGCRRNYDQIKDFCEAWNEKETKPIIEKIKAGEYGPDYKYCFDASLIMLSQNILNPKQFDDLYWCYLEPLLQAYAQMGKNPRIFTEGKIDMYADHFADIKRYANVIENRLEDDDCTLETVIEDNRQALELAMEHKVNYILIDDKYEIEL